MRETAQTRTGRLLLTFQLYKKLKMVKVNNPITGLDKPCGFQISRQSALEGGKVVSPTHRPPLPPRKYSWYSFLLEAESTREK